MLTGTMNREPLRRQHSAPPELRTRDTAVAPSGMCRQNSASAAGAQLFSHALRDSFSVGASSGRSRDACIVDAAATGVMKNFPHDPALGWAALENLRWKVPSTSIAFVTLEAMALIKCFQCEAALVLLDKVLDGRFAIEIPTHELLANVHEARGVALRKMDRKVDARSAFAAALRCDHASTCRRLRKRYKKACMACTKLAMSSALRSNVSAHALMLFLDFRACLAFAGVSRRWQEIAYWNWALERSRRGSSTSFDTDAEVDGVVAALTVQHPLWPQWTRLPARFYVSTAWASSLKALTVGEALSAKLHAFVYRFAYEDRSDSRVSTTHRFFAEHSVVVVGVDHRHSSLRSITGEQKTLCLGLITDIHVAKSVKTEAVECYDVLTMTGVACNVPRNTIRLVAHELMTCRGVWTHHELIQTASSILDLRARRALLAKEREYRKLGNVLAKRNPIFVRADERRRRNYEWNIMNETRMAKQSLHRDSSICLLKRVRAGMIACLKRRAVDGFTYAALRDAADAISGGETSGDPTCTVATSSSIFEVYFAQHVLQIDQSIEELMNMTNPTVFLRTEEEGTQLHLAYTTYRTSGGQMSFEAFIASLFCGRTNTDSAQARRALTVAKSHLNRVVSDRRATILEKVRMLRMNEQRVLGTFDGDDDDESLDESLSAEQRCIHSLDVQRRSLMCSADPRAENFSPEAYLTANTALLQYRFYHDIV